MSRSFNGGDETMQFTVEHRCRVNINVKPEDMKRVEAFITELENEGFEIKQRGQTQKFDTGRVAFFLEISLNRPKSVSGLDALLAFIERANNICE